MSKARELAELSRTVSDSADAVAITIDSSENVTFANDITVTGALTLGSTAITATGTELNYVDGVTSAIQTQLDGKATAAQADQTVVLTGSGGTTVSGTYPNFTISSSVGTTGIVDNSNATAITLNADESATFAGALTGTSATFTGTASVGNSLFLRDGSTTRGKIELNASDTDDIDIIAVSLGSKLKFHTVGTEVGQFDALGNFLVGKTVTTFGTAGINLNQSGSLDITKASDGQLFLNRLTSNGPMAYFYQDGTNRGIIGTVANDLFITSADSGHNGLRFHANGILPTNNAGAIVDADADLGDASYRFKDLYLSGGAFIGGTGSANKLDDFEEGSWTPVMSSDQASHKQPVDFVPPNSQLYGSYTKIGKRVWLSYDLYVDWQNWRSSGGGNSAAEGDIRMGGFPFPLANSTTTANDINHVVFTEKVRCRFGSIPSDATLIYYLELQNNNTYATLFASRESISDNTEAFPPDWKYDVRWGFRLQGSLNYLTT